MYVYTYIVFSLLHPVDIIIKSEFLCVFVCAVLELDQRTFVLSLSYSIRYLFFCISVICAHCRFFNWILLIGTHLSCLCISFAHTYASASAIISCQMRSLPRSTTNLTWRRRRRRRRLPLLLCLLCCSLFLGRTSTHFADVCVRACVLCAWWNRHLFKKSFIFVACVFCCFAMPMLIMLYAQRLFLCLLLSPFSASASWPVWLTLTTRTLLLLLLFFASFFMLSLIHTHRDLCAHMCSNAWHQLTHTFN